MEIVFESPEAMTAESSAQPSSPPQQPQQSQQHPTPTGRPAPSDVRSSEVGKLEQELARLTGPDSRYMKLAMTDPRDPQRVVELKEITRLRDAIEAAGARTNKMGHDAKEDPDAELREPLPEDLTEMLPNPPIAEGWSVPDELAGRSLGAELGVPSNLVNDAAVAVAQGGASKQFNTQQETIAAAQAAWGEDFDARDAHLNLALETAGPEMIKFAQSAGLLRNLAFLTYISDIGAAMAQAEADINTLREDKRYTDRSHPEHRLAQAEMTRLMAIRYPLKRG